MRPAAWEQMKTMARALSEPFRYVRVDLYDYESRPIFGELTFWPKAGCYKSKDEHAFGQLLDFDTTFKRPMIHDIVEGQEGGPIRALADMVRRNMPRREPGPHLEQGFPCPRGFLSSPISLRRGAERSLLTVSQV